MVMHFSVTHRGSSGCGLVLILLGGLSQLVGCTQATKPAAAPPAKPQVTVAHPVKMGIVEWDEYIGRLEALETVDIRSRVSGYLAATNFDEGQIVNAGEVLVVIDQRPFLAEVARNEANLAAAKAQLGQAESLKLQTTAEKKGSDIRLSLAQKLVNRTEELRRKNASTEEELEVRQAELAQAESDVAVAVAKIESAEASVVAAKAAVETAMANLELAKLDLQYTEIRAPITGRISRRYVTEGNLVSGGTADSTLLTTIVSIDPIHCYFDADEQSFLKYVRLAREGKRASSRDVRNPVYLALSNERDGYPHEGHMDFVENRLDQETATIRGRAILPNKNMDLTPGLFARVRLPGSPRYEAIMVPDRAIGTDQAEKFVLTVDDKQTVQRKLVTLGPISHGLRVVRTGLTGSELVVISGLQRARPGTEVVATEETISPGKESLPDEYQPVPEEKWLNPKRSTAANVWIPKVSPVPIRQTVKTVPPQNGREALQ